MVRGSEAAQSGIAGGGFIGLEMAEQLARRGLDVTIIDSKDQVLPPLIVKWPKLCTMNSEAWRQAGTRGAD